MYTMIGLGVVTAALALFDLAMPGRIGFEGLVAVMGVLFVIAPWVMDFNTGFTALAWTAWIVGGVSLVAGLADIQMTRTEQRHAVTNR